MPPATSGALTDALLSMGLAVAMLIDCLGLLMLALRTGAL